MTLTNRSSRWLYAGAVLLSAASAPAATICVEPTGAGGCQTTIGNAVAMAVAGDTINVNAGVYNEFVTVGTGLDGLTITGKGAIIDGSQGSGELLVILSNNVTIEGLTLRNNDSTGIRIGQDSVTEVQNTRIAGVSIKGAGSDCIRNEGSDGTVISGVRMLSCGDESIDGREGTDGSNNMVIEKSVMWTGDDGCIDVTGNGVKVIGNKLTMCEDDPCINLNGANALVEGNKLSQCDADGVAVSGDFAVVRKNKMHLGTDPAVEVIGKDPTVVKNKASGFEGIYIDCLGCTGGLVEANSLKNVFDESTGYFYVQADAPGLVVNKNTVNGSAESCFRFAGTGLTVTGNKGIGCGGQGNRDGFRIEASNSTFSGNLAKTSGESGFRIEASNVVLDGNIAQGNYGPGFEVAAAATGVQLTDNSASGNAGPGFAVRDALTAVTLTGNSSAGNSANLCQDDGSAVITDGMGNSFSLAAPPVCPTDR